MSRPRTSADGRRPTAAGLFPWALSLGGLGLAAWFIFFPSPEVAPGRVNLATLSARRVQSAVALNAIAGGAVAGQAELAAKRSAPPPDRLTVRLSAATAFGLGPVADFDPTRDVAYDDPKNPPPAIRLFGVKSSAPYLERDKAEADALERAREKLAEVFAALRSPIRELPTDEEMRDYVQSMKEQTPTPAEKLTWQDGKLGEDRVWKVATVAVSEEQLRQLRARQRLPELVRWALAVLAGLAVVYALLRADDRSQGYFTWLWALVGAALVGGVVTLAIVL